MHVAALAAQAAQAHEPAVRKFKCQNRANPLAGRIFLMISTDREIVATGLVPEGSKSCRVR